MIGQIGFEVSVAVVFAGIVMKIIFPIRREIFDPLSDVAKKAIFGVVYVDPSRNVHRTDEAKPVFHARAFNGRFDVVLDINQGVAFGNFDEEILCVVNLAARFFMGFDLVTKKSWAFRGV